MTPADERGVMRNVSWNLYDRLTDAIRERSSITVAFDGKDMEIMVVGPLHESLGELLGIFVCEVCDGLDLDFHGLGRTTLKRPEVDRGIEADLSYCFDPAKVAVCRAALASGSNDPRHRLGSGGSPGRHPHLKIDRRDLQQTPGTGSLAVQRRRRIDRAA